jgi:hypothetical protein
MDRRAFVAGTLALLTEPPATERAARAALTTRATVPRGGRLEDQAWRRRLAVLVCAGQMSLMRAVPTPLRD